MSEIDSGGPAFPVVCENGLGHVTDGMSKREYFAAMALQGMMDKDVNTDPQYIGNSGKWADVVAWRAYKYADSMIRAGEGGK